MRELGVAHGRKRRYEIGRALPSLRQDDMHRLRRLAPRQWLIVNHDLLVTAAAPLAGTLVLRFQEQQLAARLEWLPTLLGFLVLAAGIYFFVGLHE